MWLFNWWLADDLQFTIPQYKQDRDRIIHSSLCNAQKYSNSGERFTLELLNQTVSADIEFVEEDTS